MTESGERERFEKWAAEAFGGDISRFTKRAQENPDEYVAADLEWAWRAWQAAFEAGRGGWISVETKLPADYEKVDVWFNVWASPLSFGMSDSWRETECWLEDGKWFHHDKMHQSAKRELEKRYITHWQSLPAPPDSGDANKK